MLFAKKKRSISRILVVEDEPLVAFDNEHFLRDGGYVVVATVDRVEDALTAIAREQIDLILLDLSLSDGGTGLDVAHAAKAAAIPVLFVTGDSAGGAHALGVGLLSKPYPQRDLKIAIEAVDASIAGRKIPRLPPGLRLFSDDATDR